MPMRIGEVVRSQFSDEEGENGIGNLLPSAEGAEGREREMRATAPAPQARQAGYASLRVVAELSADLSPPHPLR